MRSFFWVKTRWVAVLIAGFLLAAPTLAGEQLKCLAVKGVLLKRIPDQGWKPVAVNESIPGGLPLVALFEATLQSSNQAVEIKFFGDIGVHGPLPVLEAAAILQDKPGLDLDVTLQRGILILTNNKKSGTAKIGLHLRADSLDVDLAEPGSKLAIQVMGRHTPGLAGIKRDEPTAFVFFMVARGRVVLSQKDKSITLRAPPGPAFLRWDSIDRKPEVEFLKELPREWKRTDQEEIEYKKMCSAAQTLNENDPVPTLVKMLQAGDRTTRMVGVTGLGALDALPQLLGALAESPKADVCQQAIIVLRSWLGRHPGQIKILRSALEERKLTATQARNTIHLLFGFDEVERSQPATYDLLIGYLDHPKLAIRELAHWHLVRLAPAGRDITYQAAGAPDERQQAIKRWRALIPPGQLPPQPKKNTGK